METKEQKYAADYMIELNDKETQCSDLMQTIMSDLSNWKRKGVSMPEAIRRVSGAEINFIDPQEEDPAEIARASEQNKVIKQMTWVDALNICYLEIRVKGGDA